LSYQTNFFYSDFLIFCFEHGRFRSHSSMDMTLEERRESRVRPHFPCESELWAAPTCGVRSLGLCRSIQSTCDHSHLTPPAPAPWSHHLRLQMKRVTAKVRATKRAVSGNKFHKANGIANFLDSLRPRLIAHMFLEFTMFFC